MFVELMNENPYEDRHTSFQTDYHPINRELSASICIWMSACLQINYSYVL